jgi:cytochrome P450
MRLYTVIGIGPTRVVKKRMQLGPYTLPKGTVVWAMLTAMHKSPRVWDDPESFIPVLARKCYRRLLWQKAQGRRRSLSTLQASAVSLLHS